MISSLRGIIIEKDLLKVVIEVSGVGYEVEMPLNSIASLPEVGKETKIYTHLIIREDSHQLFGFLSKVDRSLFCELIKINGVGPKSAITIMSSISVSELVDIVNTKDAKLLTKIPGVGPKTAERLMVELKGRIDKWSKDPDIATQIESVPSSSSSKVDISIQDKKKQEDAIQALISLGYTPKVASSCVKTVFDPSLSLSDIIKLSLQQVIGSK